MATCILLTGGETEKVSCNYKYSSVTHRRLLAWNFSLDIWPCSDDFTSIICCIFTIWSQLFLHCLII